VSHPYWIEPQRVTLPYEFTTVVGGHPLIAQILYQRGITEPRAAQEFLNSDFYQPADPLELPDLEQAVNTLRHAKKAGWRICVWGDFDVDGQTSTTLLVDALRQLDYDVFYYIPERAGESHGLNTGGIQTVIQEQHADLILTCDCGVSNLEEVAYAYELGAKVIVTDHHELLPELPACEAVVNPQRLPETHPLRVLCGVGVAYMVVKVLYEMEGRHTKSDQWLDLVALGTIADVAVLQHDNRYLVQKGLPQLMYQPRPGLAAIFEVGGITPSELLETEIVGFGLGPRLNAVGRLDHAKDAVELLLAKDEMVTRRMAMDLEVYNEQRKQYCDEVEEDAERILRYQPQLLDEPALVLSGTNWHPGVIGIVASRLVERYNKATILISTSPEEGVGRASARSVEGLHLQNAIFKHQDLLLGGGGHAMAAGFAIQTERIPEFRRAFQQTVIETQQDDALNGAIAIEGWVTLPEITADFIRDLYRLAPFGAGNPKPVLGSQNVRLTNVRAIGANRDHTRLVIVDSQGQKITGLWWRKSSTDIPDYPVDVAFTVNLNEFRGSSTPQIILRDVRPYYATPVVANTPPLVAKNDIQVIDYRHDPHRLERIHQLATEHGDRLQIWAEGTSAKAIDKAVSRAYLKPSPKLVIASAPAAPDILNQILHRVSPEQIFVITTEEVQQTPTDVIKAVAGAVKTVLAQSSGQTTWAELAGAVGQRAFTVKHALDVLVEMGKLSYTQEGNRVRIKPQPANVAPKADQEALKALLQETAAYQRYFNRVNLTELIQ